MKAFPKTSSYDENNGMELRDYFAAHAMQGILATTHEGEFDYLGVAGISYQMADAMMKAREQ